MAQRRKVHPNTSKVMRANRGRDTKPELAIRSQIHKAGLRYAIDSRPEPELNRRADLVFRKVKVAVYVHGCFWHGCQKHYSKPRTNRQFWVEKVKKNRRRDVDTLQYLKRKGWEVLIFWEHQDSSHCSQKIIRTVRTKKALVKASY